MPNASEQGVVVGVGVVCVPGDLSHGRIERGAGDTIDNVLVVLAGEMVSCVALIAQRKYPLVGELVLDLQRVTVVIRRGHISREACHRCRSGKRQIVWTEG